MDKLDRLVEEMAENRVHLQHLRVQMEIASEKLDDLLLWQREVKTQMRITAAIASVVGGIAGFLVSTIFA